MWFLKTNTTLEIRKKEFYGCPAYSFKKTQTKLSLKACGNEIHNKTKH
jgi:hypothetical protein